MSVYEGNASLVNLPAKRGAPPNSSEAPNKMRKIDQNEAVRNHYDARKDQGLKKRNESPIFHLRNFNNWTKSILLKKYITASRRNEFKPRQERHCFALDLCCGKMGDAPKWRIGNINCVVGADIALESLKDGLKRYQDGHMYKKFSLSLIHADCTVSDIQSCLPDKNILFDICSCQFALHYGFGTPEHARMLIKNASQNLRKGGYFVGTIPNASVLL